MTEVRKCIFCGAGPLTKTHIISKKLQDMLPPMDAQSARRSWWGNVETGESIDDSRVVNVSPLNHQVKRACAGCNNYWMNDIEESTRALVVSLAAGEARILSPKEWHDLATWSTIVAMLRATQEGGPSIMHPNDYQYIRDTSSPPPGYHFALLRGVRRDDLPTRHSRNTLSGVETHVTFFWIGEMIALVFNDWAIRQISRKLGLIHSSRAFDCPDGSVPWPPRSAVTFETLFTVTDIFSPQN